jgi:hypothetical protein
MRWKSRAATLLAMFAIVTCGPEAPAPSFGEPLLAGIFFGTPQRAALQAVNVARTEWRCVDGKPLLFVVGTVTILNLGTAASEELTLVDRIEEGASGGAGWNGTPGGLSETLPPIQPGETLERSYAFALPGWESAGAYRHVVSVGAAEGVPEPGAADPATAVLVVHPPVNLCAVTCTLASTYWRVHGPGAPTPYADLWPVESLTLGTVSYEADEVQDILAMSSETRGELVGLAHELIAAKLNVAAGADPRAAAAVMRAADALIGSGDLRSARREGSAAHAPALTRALAEYNRGAAGPGGCG